MKSRLLPLLLGSTLIFAACGQDEKQTEDTKTEEKATEEKTTETASETKSTESTESASESDASEVKDAKSLVEKAQEKGKGIKSYHANLDTQLKSGSDTNNVKMEMSVDDADKTKISTDMQNQSMDMYIFDKKVIITQDGQNYIDATSVMEDQVKNQLDQLDYNSALKTLDAYKDGEFKAVDNGYEITKSFKGLEEYKKLSEATGSEDAVKALEGQLKDIEGKATITFDKDLMMSKTITDINMTVKDKKMNTKTTATYDQYNQVKAIEIPEGAKNAQSIEELQKSQETSTEKVS
ncbi:hypothetical protein ETI03_09605 [Macrococcoides canis]|uniref:DUF6612 family protein n=1 Tax=Macrococcoides canis TaxID=1855823 RepID=UPI00106148F5|nr:DUF6612 family protein [Macrococcus canis]TDM29836.1 hypothetical protein ETI03_09605 [Macrococcus canis]